MAMDNAPPVDQRTGLPKKVLKEYWSKQLPQKVSFLVFKRERIMEIWALEENRWNWIETYDILGASGDLGPKLKEGDRQVPEGIYRIIGLNPKSRFHRSMLIDYPNEFDREMAKHDTRTGLGGEICIHGGAASIGCIAMGDEVSEDLFWLVSSTGMRNIKVIISPYDFRKNQCFGFPANPQWTIELYEIIKNELKQY
jgi:murein L,D-transpeptidase YafK